MESLFRFFNSGKQKNREAVIFLHIPKTAGTSLQTIINNHFQRDLIYELDNSSAQRSTEVFKNLPLQEKKKYKVVLGHMWFGIHNYMPQSASYITVLRDPVSRVVSHYYFVKRRKDHYLHEIVESKKLSLKEYVESGLSTELNNGQTRLLSDETDEETYCFGNCPEKMLKQAQNNLDKHFSVVGLQEEFDDTLALIQKILGWQTPKVVENVTQNRPAVADVPPDTLEIIKHYNRLDIELYNYAAKIFSQMKKTFLT